MQPTIKQLRQQGYKIRVIHKRLYRPTQKFSGFIAELCARGGSTTIELTTPDKKFDVIAQAVCSTEDNFSRKTGNSIALGRALKQLENLQQIEEFVEMVYPSKKNIDLSNSLTDNIKYQTKN